MALYSLDDFKALVSSSKWEYLNIKRPRNTLDKLDWNESHLVQVLMGLHRDDFQKTVPNCKVNEIAGLEVVTADQYEIHWDPDAGRQSYSSRTTISLSLKIAVMTDSDGQTAGLVTFHLSGSPW